MTAEKPRQQEPVTSDPVRSREMNECEVTCPLTFVLSYILFSKEQLPLPRHGAACSELSKATKENETILHTHPTIIDSLSMRDNLNCLYHVSLSRVILGYVKLTMKLTFPAGKGTL